MSKFFNFRLLIVFFFFFFQAEDGIRDRTVTGVQTCALPILKLWRSSKAIRTLSIEAGPARAFSISMFLPEIGRASCREKSVDLGGRRMIKKKKNEVNESEGIERESTAEQESVVIRCSMATDM